MSSLSKAIDELREWNERERAAERQERLRSVLCPDCGAELRIESADQLPADIKIVFVKHCA